MLDEGARGPEYVIWTRFSEQGGGRETVNAHGIQHRSRWVLSSKGVMARLRRYNGPTGGEGLLAN